MNRPAISTSPQRPNIDAGNITQNLKNKPRWTEGELTAHAIPIYDVPFASVGGGLGSFAMVDLLRIAGVRGHEITVLSDLKRPTENFEHLAMNSQLPKHGQLRVAHGSALDCIWGWPGYGVREALQTKSPTRLWQAMTASSRTPHFNPQAGQLYGSVARESARIGWDTLVNCGVVRTIRRCEAGGYFVLFAPEPDESTPKLVAYRSPFVHLAVGYPGVTFLPDLQRYRNVHQDFVRVVNAYEPHPHVYEKMLRKPSTVLVRGSGSVASRVLQRIMDDRDHNEAQTKIIHLSHNGAMSGANTAPRTGQEQLNRGLSQGFYSHKVGTVAGVTPIHEGEQIRTTIRTPNGRALALDADFIIDASGVKASIEEHPVLRDLLDFSGASKNPMGGLDVGPDFLVRGTESGPGRLYACGSITAGGLHADVDSFVGLQRAARHIHDALIGTGFCKKIGPRRSLSQWIKWATNRAI